jgi:hypothetical protein
MRRSLVVDMVPGMFDRLSLCQPADGKDTDHQQTCECSFFRMRFIFLRLNPRRTPTSASVTHQKELVETLGVQENFYEGEKG